MSRLTRTDESTSDGDQSPVGLAQSKVVALIKACQSLCGDIAHDEFMHFLADYDRALSHAIDGAKSNQQVQKLMRDQREFKRSKNAMKKLFCFNLTQGFNKFSRKELSTKLETPKDMFDGGSAQVFSLIDDDTLNESIAVSSLLLKVQIQCKESLWVLNNRFAILNDGAPVKGHNNPISPVQFCVAFRGALSDVNLNQEAKALAYTVFTDSIVTLCEAVLTQTNTYLKGQGVLPHLSYTHSHRTAKNIPAKNKSDSSMLFGSAPRLSPEQSALNQEEMMSAIRRLQEASSLRLPAATEYVENNQMLDFFGQLQSSSAKGFSAAAARQKEGAPLNIEMTNVTCISKALDATTEKQLSRTGSETIDLVGRVFSFMLSDQALPNQVKALLSHLHTPFLKIAFMDTQFFEQVEHPARELLDTLADAGVSVLNDDDTLNIKLYEHIKNTVNIVITDFDNDLRLITKVLIDFKRYMRSVKHRQQITEQRTTEKIKGQEMFESVNARVNSYIQSAIVNRDIPSTVLIFLLQPWSDYLSFILLRHGDCSSQWEVASQVVDDLLWSICTHQSSEDKIIQTQKKSELAKNIQSGFILIEYDEAQAKIFLDELDLIITHAINNKSTIPASSEVREKIEKKAALNLGNIKIYSQPESQEEARMMDNLKYLEYGSWFELDGVRRVKLAWFNRRMDTYLFVDQTGRKVEMVTSIDMVKGLINKKIQLIPGSAKPFFERALESIYSQLNAEYHKDNV